MPQVGAHRGRQREVLRRRTVISGPGQREAEPELRVIIAGAGVNDPAEAAGRLDVMPCVELGSSERLKDAARVRLRGGGPLEKLSRRCRATSA